MKTSKISISCMLMAFITFRSHAMENALTDPSKLLPLIREIPYQGFAIAIALNPNKPELAIGSLNTISLVNLNTPDKPDSLTVAQDEPTTLGLAYNPLGTLLAYSVAAYETGIIDLLSKKISHKTKPMANNYQFNLEGNKLVMCMENNIIIWDLKNGIQTPVDLHKEWVGATYISRIFNGNTFVHSYSNDASQGTVVWHLDNPSEAKKVNIDPNYATIFGNNEKQLASYTPDYGLIGHTIQLMHDKTTTSTQVNGLIDNCVYCPPINKYLFAIVNPENTDVSVLMIDPETFDSKELYSLKGSSDSSIQYGRPYFSPDGKLFVLAGGGEGTLKYCYIDLIDEYTKLSHTSSSQSSSSYRCTII